jgi:signal recognition particle receptor subunit beta
MAVLDSSENEIVIRVVYDGPPESGKTTSLRALAGSLVQTVVTPGEDPTGRTLWFDWMEYVGGRFEGSRIRCQIVSVPGQRELDARRRRLLSGADAVVSVVDTTPPGLARSAQYVRELRAAIAGSTVGVVLQANKRDVADAIELEEVRVALGGPTVGLVESVAADGTGIREAFVYAVRLALDRVRDLMSRGALEVGPPELRSAAELLAVLRGAEAVTAPVIVASDTDSIAATALVDVLDAETEAAEREVDPVPGYVPSPPDATVPSGAIWPPVEGRAILAEVSQLGLSPHQFGNGDWVMGLGSGWRVVSSRDSCFRTLDEGRAALIQWARLHATSSSVLSPRRCIVLADAGDGSWRLWQIVRVEESLREIMVRAIDEPTPELTVLRFCQAGKQLLEAAARVASSPCDLPCTLDTIGIAGGLALFIGLMPAAVVAEPRRSIPPTTLLRTQLQPVVAVARLGERGAALQQLIDRVPKPVSDRDGIMSTLVSLFA